MSPHTIASYRDAFRLLLRFAQERLGKAPATLALDGVKRHARRPIAYLTRAEIEALLAAPDVATWMGVAAHICDAKAKAASNAARRTPRRGAAHP